MIAVLMFAAKLVGTLVMGALASIIGNNADAEFPVLAKRLVRAAAKWHPEGERKGFVDEMDGHIDGYTADGNNLRALVQVGLAEWRRAAITRGAPAWLTSQRSDHLGQALTLGLIFGLGGVLTGSLAGGLTFGMASGLVGVLTGWKAGRLDAVPLRKGLIGGLAGGLILGVLGTAGGTLIVGLIFGLVGPLYGLSFWFAPIVGRALMVRVRQLFGPTP